jgi:acyl-coenzyme A synthetase/AMP-(fatty) acid ligase
LREDDADGFRWDPQDDQRYALRYDNPSLAGAAPTVVGANRLQEFPSTVTGKIMRRELRAREQAKRKSE